MRLEFNPAPGVRSINFERRDRVLLGGGYRESKQQDEENCSEWRQQRHDASDAREKGHLI
jgi:hypothetical protein